MQLQIINQQTLECYIYNPHFKERLQVYLKNGACKFNENNNEEWERFYIEEVK